MNGNDAASRSADPVARSDFWQGRAESRGARAMPWAWNFYLHHLICLRSSVQSNEALPHGLDVDSQVLLVPRSERDRVLRAEEDSSDTCDSLHLSLLNAKI